MWNSTPFITQGTHQFLRKTLIASRFPPRNIAARQSCPSWSLTTPGGVTWTPPQKLGALDISRGTSGHPTGIPKGRSRPPSTATSSTTSRRPKCALCISPRSTHQNPCIRLFSPRMAAWCPSTFRRTGKREDSRDFNY